MNRMKKLISISLLLTFSLLTAHGVKSPEETISIRQLPSETPADVVATIRYTEENNGEWWDDEPVFSVSDESTGMSGAGWLATTREHLLIRLTTKDSDHIPPPPSSLWAGDAIELCIDARGDGTWGLEKDKIGTFGPDDAKFMIALTEEGPRGNGKRQPLPAEWLSIHRNPATMETIYELRLPWAFLETPPGLFPVMGIAVQFNNQQPDKQDKDVLKWGDGTYGPFRPGLFNRLSVEPPAGEHCAAAIGKTVLWDPSDTARVLITTSGENKKHLNVRMGNKRRRYSIAPSKNPIRYEVQLHPGKTRLSNIPFTVTLAEKGSKAPLLEKTGDVELPENAYHTLLSMLDAAMANADHPLLRRHLISVRSIAQSEWARLKLYQTEKPLVTAATHEKVKRMIDGLKTDAGEWAPYLERRRNLIFAYVSPKDHTVQYYQFALPKNWDPEKKYPLFFELHGSGDPNPLGGATVQMSAGKTESGLLGYSTPTTYAAREGLGYYCQPYGRGNLSYKGISEVDVWEAYNDVHQNFKIDADRRYLFGFSMGGSGTWSIGTRTPDRWAAIAILAGGTWRERPNHDLGLNLTQTPVYVYCGDRDFLFKYVDVFRAELDKFGIEPLVKITPGMAHAYTDEVQADAINWLTKHTRKRPDEFSFVADTDEHRGVWGVTMHRDLSISGLPRFTCRIENSTIHLESEGTPGIEVKAGENGLNLNDPIVIYWNGEEAYRGPAKTIQLGTPHKNVGF